MLTTAQKRGIEKKANRIRDIASQILTTIDDDPMVNGEIWTSCNVACSAALAILLETERLSASEEGQNG